MTVTEQTVSRAHALAKAILEEKPRPRQSQGPGYPYETLLEFTRDPDEHAKHWLVKNAVAWGETSAWIGPPGSLKSALMADLAISVAFGRDWHGKKSKTSGGSRVGVVYFALERGDLVKRRIAAQITSLNLDSDDDNPPSITVVSGLIDLKDASSVKKAALTIQNIEAFTGGGFVGLVIFDTFAKLVAAGGGDENSAKDQGLVLANLERFKDLTGKPHVALVGHTGKDETRGARGSNAIVGDVDMMVMLTGTDIKTATVTKANDMPEGVLFSFKGAIHQFGVDEDGDAITVNYIADEDVLRQLDAKPANGRMSPRNRNALVALTDCLLDNGVQAPPSIASHAGLSKVVTVDQWRAEIEHRGILAELKNERSGWQRIRDDLQAAQKVGIRDNYVWTAYAG